VGKQLQPVLAIVPPFRRNYRSSGTWTFAGAWHGHGTQVVRSGSRSTESLLHRAYRASSCTTIHSAAVVSPTSLERDHEPLSEATTEPGFDMSDSAYGSRRWKNRTRSDHLSEALSDAGMYHALPEQNERANDQSHVNTKSRTGRQQYHLNAARHSFDSLIPLAQSTEVSLERLAASCIRYRAANADTVAGAIPFRPLGWEASFLHSKGYDVHDVEKWADILSAKDSLAAAAVLANADANHKQHAVPLFVLLYLLRRQHINPRALRIMIGQAWRTLGRRAASGRAVGEATVFTIFVRLVRHAREVWPEATDSIAEMLLVHLPYGVGMPTDAYGKRLHGMTYLLNKAMHLISLPTAVAPYDDAVHQEVAIVRILRFMSEHTPSLEINREGYRAVIRVQLAHEKTGQERRWAELKALSWPPWKHERTAMDALVTHTEHGVSRAANTLRRMVEAGYNPLAWEKAAQLYAGWDVDGTPTIQTRTVLGSGNLYSRDAAIWVARIATTRTVQEAWAAYLAYEDINTGQSQAVYLAVFKRLYEEERRPRIQKPGVRVQRHERVLSGDGREAEPLPPSTHLYTYTRTTPPTVEAFFRQLSGRGVTLSGECLAFIVQNASSLQLGHEFLRHAYPDDGTGSPSLRPAVALQHRSSSVFVAYIGLLCRFSNIPLSKVDGDASNIFPVPSLTLKKHSLNRLHPLIHAIALLDAYRPTQRPAWNLVLQAFSREATLKSMRFVVEIHTQVPEDEESAKRRQDKGAVLAYRLVRRVLRMFEELHIDLDTTGLHYACLAAERLTLACWRILRQDVRDAPPHYRRSQAPKGLMYEVNALRRSNSHVSRLKGLFRILVGDDPADTTAPSSGGPDPRGLSGLPRLLVTPSPALLHAYIRALGWMADYDGLLGLTRWMVAHQTELAQQRARERKGEHSMRLAVIALRVFLDRHWLAASVVDGVDAEDDAEGGVDTGGSESTSKPRDPRVRSLRRLETPASANLVAQVRDLVAGVEDWRGWPDEREMDGYCRQARFEEVCELYR